MKRIVFVLVSTLLLGACAIGNQYSYESPGMNLPAQGPGEIGLLVVDRRPYVLDGHKPPNFVGLQRGGYGNPFDVTTQSGKPMSVEMQSSLASALVDDHFEVKSLSPAALDDSGIVEAVRLAGASRNIVLILNEWKTDAMMNFGISCDVELRILGSDGALLASTRSKAVKEKLGGAGFESGNAVAASRAFESKMNQLFSDPKVLQIMNSESK